MSGPSFSNHSRRGLIAGGLALSALAPVPALAQVTMSWTRLPGAARDVGCGGGQVFVIGTDPLGGGYGIFRWNGRDVGDAWERLPGAATNISVDDTGSPWVVNDQNGIFRWNGADWTQMPGAATDIAAAGGEVFVTGTDRVGGGYSIHRWSRRRRAWERIDGGAVRVAVDRSGRPWVVNDQGQIFSRSRGEWTRHTGAARDIGSGGGQVYVIGTNAVGGGYGIFRYTGAGPSDWLALQGGGVRIAADHLGQPWVVNSEGGIFRAS